MKNGNRRVVGDAINQSSTAEKLAFALRTRDAQKKKKKKKSQVACRF
jgi:hypothetical protein